jgi:hypothetical protein
MLSSMTPFVPWMTIDGNHERDWPGTGSWWGGLTDSGGECGVALAQRFHMPNNWTRLPHDQTWWSLNFGPVHFTVFSTEHEWNSTSVQYAWLRKDLAAVDRTKTPFLIVSGHRPMYSGTSQKTTLESALLAEFLEPLMKEYMVDVAFWGHHHVYEVGNSFLTQTLLHPHTCSPHPSDPCLGVCYLRQRTCAAYNWTCVDPSEGTVHIVTGAAGAPFSNTMRDPVPSWLLYYNFSTHGYVNAHVVGGRSLRLDFIDARTRNVIDTVTVQSRFHLQQQKAQQRSTELAAE